MLNIYFLTPNIEFPHTIFVYTLNNAGLLEPKFGSNMDKPKCWVKNVISNFHFQLYIFLIDFLGLSIFDPNLG